MRFRQIIACLVIRAFVLIAAPPQTATASTLSVTSTADSGPGSLREAIDNAASGDSITFRVKGTIRLTSGGLSIQDKDLKIVGPGADVLAVDGTHSNGVILVVNAKVTISGLTIQHGSRLPGVNDFDGGGGIDNFGDLSILNCAILDNFSLLGGGIFNHDILTISNSTIAGNSAIGGGGLINAAGTDQLLMTISNSTIVDNSAFVNHGSLDSDGGGGIWNMYGTLNIGSSIVAENNAQQGSADIVNGISDPNNPAGTDDNPLISLGHNLIGETNKPDRFLSTDHLHVDLSHNPLVYGAGSAQIFVFQDNSLILGKGNCQLGTVSSTPPAPSVANDQRGTARKTPCDVGAYESPASLTTPTYTQDSTPTGRENKPIGVVSNTHDDGLGSLRYVLNQSSDNTTITFDPTVFRSARLIVLTSGPLVIAKAVTIQGPGANLLTLDGGYASNLLVIQGHATVNLSGLTIQHGRHRSDPGGAITNSGVLMIRNSTISDSTAIEGGGLYNTGKLTLEHCTVWGNFAADSGSGMENHGGSLTISNSTISGNFAPANDGGGGITNMAGKLTVNSSTISDNQANVGSGINNTGTAILSNTTIADNFAGDGAITNEGTLAVGNSTIASNYGVGIGGIDSSGGTLILGSSIVAGNNAAYSYTPADILSGSSIQSLGNNIIGDAGKSTGFATSDQQKADPRLYPLTQNGGFTQTMALHADSPAIKNGNCALNTVTNSLSLPSVNVDQHGVSRKKPCDAGAYETNVSS